MIRRESVQSYSTNDDSIDDQPDSTWNSIKRYVYNSQKKTCCERSLKQWMMMIIYYIGYTAFILCLYLAFLYASFAIIKHTNPDFPLIDKESLLETAHPGLGFVPNIIMSKYPIIWYSPDPLEQKNEEVYIKALDKFFEKYKSAKRENYADCKNENKGDKPCFFDLEKLKDCNVQGYQYTNSSLCFFLKMNKLHNWTPLYYAKEEIDFPDEMSQSMMDFIKQSTEKNVLFVECLGENLWDNEYLGVMEYFPRQGFEDQFFPYVKEPYLPPLVAVKLSQITTGVVIHIKCTVWAKNIGQRLNHLHLKVFIDNTLPY